MFRTLATRLTAAYVFAAIVLVVIVVAAVTAFALSVFGLGVRAASASLERQAPEEVRLEVARAGSLEAAAVNIVRRLARPGLHVMLFTERSVAGTGIVHRHFLAATGPEGSDGRAMLLTGDRIRSTLPGPPAPSLAPGDNPFGKDGKLDRMRPFPFGLNVLLKLEPRSVDFNGGRIVIIPDRDSLARTIDAFWLAMLPMGLFVVLAAWLLGRYITGQALRPLVETTASLNRFGTGDFTPRAIVTTDRSEIGELVGAFNAAAAQVNRAFDERSVAERNMRQFIADAGHELRTPLTVVMGFIDVLRRRAVHEPGLSTRIFDTMLFESRRMKALIDKLILLARLENAQARELMTIDLGEMAEAVVNALQAIEHAPRIALESDAASFVRGDENELHDALSNLVENAIKYASGSPVRVRVRCDGAAAFVDVIDRGPGIAPADQPYVFDRFYRGSDHGETEGFGLGLAIAKRAVERAGGAIEVASVLGQGSRFTISLPRVDEKGAGLAAEQRTHADSHP
ncbi:MAG: hypothetical protein NVSMB19_10140 [Vulcanimicrobiaceae bacterium]